jgi:hypothetical protein
MPALPFQIYSPDARTAIPEGSILHAEQWLQMSCLPGTPGGWFEMASVEANIHTGIGTSTFTARGPFTVGDTVTCNWQVGWIPPTPGTFWTIGMTSTAQGNKTVTPFQTITTIQGGISYTVTTADLGSGPGGSGKLWCFLRNNLFPKDFDDVAVTTASCKSNPPSFTITGISPVTPQQGQTVTISFSSAPNGVTRSPIARIDIAWGWGNPSTQLSLGGNTTSYQFLAAQAGFITFTGIAYDSNGCPSASAKTILAINQQPPNNGIGGSGTTSNLGLILALVFLSVGLTMLLIGLYVIPQPFFLWRLPLVGGGAVLSGIGAILGINFVISLLANIKLF